MQIDFTLYYVWNEVQGGNAQQVLTAFPKMARWGLRDARARAVLGVAVGLTLGWLAVRGVDWGLVGEEFRNFPVGWAMASLGVMALFTVVRAYRWQILFLDEKPRLPRMLLVQNTGIGLNSLVPLRVAGEGIQYALLTLRYGVRGGVALGTMGVERVLDLLVTASLLMAGLTLIPDKGDVLPYVVGAFVVAVASVIAIPFLVRLSARPFLRRIPLVVSTAGYLTNLGKAKFAITLAFSLTLAYWLLVGVCGWLLAFGMGLGISAFVVTLAILGAIYFTTSLPGILASLGTFEFAIVYVLKLFGVGQTSAFSFAVGLHAILFLPPILIAVVVLLSLGLKPLVSGSEARLQPSEPAAAMKDTGRIGA